jgi:uncharacterized protein
MDALHDEDRLEILERDECLALLAAAEVGRLAFVVAGQPRIEPVNCRLVGQDLVLSSRPGAKLDAAVQEQRVAVEIDEVEEWAHAGWSVLAVGTASVVSDPDERATLAEGGPQPWAPAPGLTLIRVAVDGVSGRRVRIGAGGVSLVVQDPDVPRPQW